MDPDIVDGPPLIGDEGPFDMRDALLSIPTMSIVADADDLFSMSTNPAIGGIYTHPMEEGVAWEKPTSIELIHADGSPGFHVNCGLRIYGGMGRSPWAKKHTFRLLFKSIYGPSTFEYPLFGSEAAGEFNTVILRANFNDGWHGWHPLWGAEELYRAQYLRDEWMRATHLAMESVASHGRFVHLYVNGLYWGVYNPVERPDASFSATYQGGQREDWDGLHDGEVIEGDLQAWDAAHEMATHGLASNEAFQRLQGRNADGTPNPAYERLVDVVNLADYMLLNYYGCTGDWDDHNWYAGRRRGGQSDGYKMYVWDAETTHNYLDCTNVPNRADLSRAPSRIFRALLQNREFLLLYADRIHRHLFNDGVLTHAEARPLNDTQASRIRSIAPSQPSPRAGAT